MITFVSVWINVPCCSLAFSCSNTLHSDVPQADISSWAWTCHTACVRLKSISQAMFCSQCHLSCLKWRRQVWVRVSASLQTAHFYPAVRLQLTCTSEVVLVLKRISALKGLQNEIRRMSKCTALVNTAVSQTLTAVRNLEISCNSVHIRVYLLLKKRFSKRRWYNDIVCSVQVCQKPAC